MSIQDFFTPFEMAEKLVKIAFAEEFALHEGLKIAAKVIEKTAKKEIGKYQSGIGPFPEWAELADSTIDEKERLGYAPPDNPLLRTGELRDSISSKVDGLVAYVGSTSDLATYHEFGTSKMPMRPFIGPAAYRNKKKIQKILGGAAISGFYDGGKNIHKSLGYDVEFNGEE